MITKFVKITDNYNDLTEAAAILKNGGLVAFPTETVYGIGADGLNEKAVQNIFKAKGRPGDNPLILHVANIEAAGKAGEINKRAEMIFKVFSPGPVTVIVKKKNIVAPSVTAGLETVAIRIPSNRIARELILKSGVPVAAPSANLSGKPSPTSFEHVKDDLNGRVDMIIDGGAAEVGIESTVVDTTGTVPMILRPGKITYEQLKKILPDIIIEKHKSENETDYKPKSPGMKYKHYAPDAKVIVFENNKLIPKELEKLKDKKTAVFCSENSEYKADFILKWGTTAEDMARKMFWALREFDKMGAQVILCETPEKGGMGDSVRNRLYKSAGFDIRK